MAAQAQLASGRPPRLLVAIAAAALTAAAAASSGVLADYWLPAAILPAGLLLAGALVARGEAARTPAFLGALTVILVGYAFLGRGFAHIGSAPVYVAEPVLLLAGLVILAKVFTFKLTPLHWLLTVFMFWGLFRTLPYVNTYGVDSLRDAVVWGYGVFAIAVSFAVRPAGFERVAALYRRFVPYFLVWVPILFVLNEQFSSYLPTAPGSDAYIPYYQPGDVGVHLAGIAGFAFAGLYTYKYKTGPIPLVLMGILWGAGFLIAGSINRGAFLACVLAIGASFFLHPSIKWLPLATAALLGLVILLAVNPTIDVRDRARDVSASQALRNATSVVSGTDDPELAATRTWRLAWWNEIIDYTINGDYFWGGKGFGVNLADDDGFQVYQDQSLRSPHNNHLTILARMGVPGFVIWAAINTVFAAGLWGARSRAKAAGDSFRAAFIAWLLIYWLAMMVNGAFTLYLEAPHEGIWFWTIFGLGLAVLRDDYDRLSRTRERLQQTNRPSPLHRRIAPVA